MKKNRIQSLKRATRFINQYNDRYGIRTAFRAISHYGYRAIRNPQVNPNESLIHVNGCKMVLVPNDQGISTELSVFKKHEPLTTKIISNTLKKGMVCLDVGSNIGYYVLLERKIIGDEGKIIAIEPSPQNFKYLQKNIELQNVKNITSFNFAGGEKDGTVTFFVNNKSNGCKVIPEGETPAHPSRGTLIKVPVKRLDDFIDELGLDRVDFLRMDVEGYELHIFRGLVNTLKKFKPIISIELHKRQLGIEGTKEFFKLMKDLDYEVESFVPRDLDVPLIGSMTDVQKRSIDELLDMIENNKVGSFLMLTLINSSKK